MTLCDGINSLIDEIFTQSNAKELMEQLGGNKFIAMTGASNISISDNGLSMKLGKNAGKATHLTISLKNDLYNLEFMNIRGSKFKVIKKLQGVSVDNLKDVISDVTGLKLTL